MSTQIESGAVPTSLSRLFDQKQDVCQRCSDRVYQMEKVGPINGVLFHKQCFKCCQCGHHLTMKTYYRNQVDKNDLELYCLKHYPQSSAVGLDAQAVGIRGALNVPRAKQVFNEQIHTKGTVPRYGMDALHIQGPVNAQAEYNRKYKRNLDHHYFPAYVVNKKKEKLFNAQQELERQHREEEDRLHKLLMDQREQHQGAIQKELDNEWETRLQELTSQFDETMARKNKKQFDKKAATVRYEEDKKELAKTMTVRMKQKKEAMTLKLQKKEQEETAELAKKQSEQMLELMRAKQEEIRQELEEEMRQKQEQNGDINDNEDGETDETVDSAAAIEEAMAALALPRELPPPHPPKGRKRDLYHDPSVFKELDDEVIRVAESDQSTWTELVRELTAFCLTDLQKARAIFRWITVKDLNVLSFDETIDDSGDNPLSLLRGIKYGTETYHTLFMRLCSYAGLACVEIKGHSKSVGYEPGMRIREDTFQNTWNAVLIDADWWPVQCNWGARHLVLNKDLQDKPAKLKKQDKIRYQYDEHYFLTDPDEFIQEFWAQDRDWQLLEHSVTLDQFEAMPFVRSVFFHYGLEFEGGPKAVVYTDNKGGCEVKVRVPEDFVNDIVFHYQIRFADRERRNETDFRGAKLERFVFHSLVDGVALFSVHVPTAASFFLEVFANKIDESNKISDDPNATMMPFRLKCACKFKIICEELVGKMHPLPNCASGEWGPSKGRRHFDLRPITHTSGVVTVDNDAEIRFRMPRQLHFLCKLRMNGVEDHQLEKFVTHSVRDLTLSVRVRPPQPGQYGLDIYARPEDAVDNHTLAHACKYLLNCTRVNDPIELTISKVDPNTSSKMQKDKWGPGPGFEELGLKALTHKDPNIIKSDTGPLVLEIGAPDGVKMSFRFVREPDDDYRDRVSMKDSGKKFKFTITFAKPGNYLLALYAKKKKESDKESRNVYNYMVRYSPPSGDDDTLKKKKSKGMFAKK